MYYKKHVFVCDNIREEGERPSCGRAGSPLLLAYMKKRLKELGLKDRIRIQRSGCLDRCELGPVQVSYPEGIWFSIKTEEDAEIFLRNYIEKENADSIRHLLLEDEN
ncbi:(2Fe-2S) ferredoxin domain-containing protein [Leptospira fluminis]|uniref:(2Fe-2S) ferredoxin domain-containing protein n=2 Tax=Leptospira TaxID=171 RepID=A0A4R9GP18_9LEPT|nr:MULTISPECIES: (2Fe-2S) ferredoxin domain-containing protein [Leptospira]TGK12546.1 (2Fe-2S) ferredoxin domain-containing protein [Leptospira fletcheri]TGK18088.1 (2Fe-2S) ferredoxin domain-containing protein [Leptospira fluminis]